MENKFLKLLRKLEDPVEDPIEAGVALSPVSKVTEIIQTQEITPATILQEREPMPRLDSRSKELFTFSSAGSISLPGSCVELSMKGRPQARELVTLHCRFSNSSGEQWRDLSMHLGLSSGFQYVRESTLLKNDRIADQESTSPMLLSSGLPIRVLMPGEAVTTIVQVEVEPALEDGTPLFVRAFLRKGGETIGETEGELLVIAAPLFNRRGCRIEVNAREKVVPNQELLVRYLVENSGKGPATHVILRGAPPQLTSYLRQSTTVDGVSVLDCSEMSPVFSERGLYLGTLSPNGKKEITYRAKVHFPLDPGVRVSARGEILSDQTSSLELEPVEFVTESSPNFSLHNRNLFQSDHAPIEGAPPSEAGLVEPGEAVTFYVRYFNSGDAHAHNVLLELVPPSNTTYMRGSTKWQGTPLADVGPGSPLFPTASGGGVNVGTVPVNEGGELTVQLRINSPLENNTVLESESHIKCDELPRKQLGTLTHRVRSLPDFSDPVVNRMDVEPRGSIEPGDILTYTLYLKNMGRTHAYNVVFRSRVPIHAAYVAGSLYWNGKRVSDIDGLSPLFTSHGFKIDCVRVEELHTLSFQVKVNDGLDNGVQLENGALISADGVESITTLPVISTVESTADFSDPRTNFVETQPQGAITPGDSVTYYLHFKNVGKVTARRLTIKGIVPSHTTCFQNKTKLNGFPVADKDKVSALFAPEGLQLGDLRAGERGTVSVQVKVASPLEKGTVINGKFEIISDDSSPAPLIVPELSVRSMPDFSSTEGNFLEVYPEAEVAPGELLTYVLHYRNSGNDDAQDLSFRIKLPECTIYEKGSTKLNGLMVSDREDKSPLFMDGGLRVGTVSAKAMGNVAFQVKVREAVSHGTVITAGGTIDCKGLPPYVTNIIQNKVCTVADFGDVNKNRLELFPGGTLYPGDMVTYTLYYHNSGRMAADDVRFKFYLPSQLTYLSTSTIVNGIPVPDKDDKCPLVREEGFALGNVRAGTGGSVSIKAQVHFPLDNGTSIVAKGSIYSDGGQVVPLAPVKAQVSASPRFDEKETNFIEAVSGGRSSKSKVTYVVNFKNTGNSIAYNVMMKGLLDPKVEYVNGTTRVNGVPLEDKLMECPCFTQSGLNIGNISPSEEGNIAFEITCRDDLDVIPYPVLVLSSDGIEKDWTIEG